MSSQMLDIQPHRDLKFEFELKKQSSCTVRLVNKTDQHVAFKVKTTSPKKYCVRPNVGLVLPKQACEFVVTMQAQKTAPPDMICKDKFLIQSTIVPVETKEEDVTSNMFSKDGRYVEECKLKVTLVAPSQKMTLEESSPSNGKLKGSTYENSVEKSQLQSSIEGLAPNHVVTKHVEDSVVENIEEFKPVEQVKFEHPKDVVLEPVKVVQSNIVEEIELKPTKNVETVMEINEEEKTMKDMLDRQPTDEAEMVTMNKLETKPRKDIGSRILNGEELGLVKDVEEMKSKLHELELKLSKAEETIVALREERKSTMQESEILQQKLAFLNNKKLERKVHVGFPFLFVCMVGLVSIIFGYSMHR